MRGNKMNSRKQGKCDEMRILGIFGNIGILQKYVRKLNLNMITYSFHPIFSIHPLLLLYIALIATPLQIQEREQTKEYSYY